MGPILIHFLLGGRPSVCGGDQNFLVLSKGGQIYFQWAKGGNNNFLRVKEGGAKIFLRMQRGEPEKIGTWRSETGGPPFPVKNDSSLMKVT